MKKTTKKVAEEVHFSTEKVELTSTAITPLELDLGREDLNSLVGKLNEVIKKVNQ